VELLQSLQLTPRKNLKKLLSASAQGDDVQQDVGKIMYKRQPGEEAPPQKSQEFLQLDDAGDFVTGRQQLPAQVDSPQGAQVDVQLDADGDVIDDDQPISLLVFVVMFFLSVTQAYITYKNF
jgi:hypothetical protein